MYFSVLGQLGLLIFSCTETSADSSCLFCVKWKMGFGNFKDQLMMQKSAGLYDL
jgi:hypothetical protein